MSWVLPRGLYGMVEPALGDPLEQARLLAEAGVGVVQLRCKGWTDDALFALGRSVGALGIAVIVNDRVEVARALGVPVHLGQDDGPDPVGVPFGRSTHTIAQARAPGGASYVGFGPVFGTTSKMTTWSARGVEMLGEAVRAAPVPVVAIGGINAANLALVKGAGAAGWAVIGAVWAAPDPRAGIASVR